MAIAGKMWPPVPPPAIRTRRIRIPSPSASVLRGVEEHAGGQEADHHRRASVRDERERQPLRREDPETDAHVDERLSYEHHRHPAREEREMRVGGPRRDVESAHHESEERGENGDRADEAELLPDVREDEIGVRVGKEEELLPSFAEPAAGHAAGRHGDARLSYLVSRPARIAVGVQERLDAPALVVIEDDRDRDRREDEERRDEEIAR